jgi:TonB family protein
LTLPKIEIPQPPHLEASQTLVAVLPEQMPVIPAPRPEVKAGEFGQAAPSTPKAVAKGLVEPSEFQAVGNAPSVLAHAKLSSAVAGFDVESTSSQAARSRTVAQGGFGDTAALGPLSTSHAEIAKSTFGNTVVANATRTNQLVSASLVNAVEILAKPRPQYTSEARAQGIEGEVLIEVVFEAGGSVRVLRVVKGLGHGLDEAARAAARNIQFHPARRDGLPVDSSAVVHIVFQLAY